MSHNVGTKNHFAKLQNWQVRVIYLDYWKGSESQRSIAKRFGVTQACVNYIINGRRWSHITAELNGR